MNTRMPIIFLAHGSPMNAIEHNQYTQAWRLLGENLEKPRAILMFSAHWITKNEIRVSSIQEPQMIYDMYGFPEDLYHVHYDAPGSPEIADEIIACIQSSCHADEGDISPIEGTKITVDSSLDSEWQKKGKKQPKITLDYTRGYDHGVWSTLVHLFPEHNIPVVCISLDYHLSTHEYIRLGESIAKLRERWILIMGSGNIVHNLSAIDWNNGPAYPWAREFDTCIADWLLAWKNSPSWESMLDFQNWGDISRFAHPTYDHLLPVFPLMGASSSDDKVEFLTPDIVMGSLSMRSVIWR